MTLLLPVLAAACAAFCVWLAVRIVNRKERWAKWTLATAVILAYPLTIGPFVWLDSTGAIPDWTDDFAEIFYSPLEFAVRTGPEPIGELHDWYVRLWWSKYNRYL